MKYKIVLFEENTFHYLIILVVVVFVAEKIIFSSFDGKTENYIFIRKYKELTGFSEFCQGCFEFCQGCSDE